MSLLETVKDVRTQYDKTMTDDECVALCNEVAWRHKADGWGLSRKESGTRGRRYDGQECAHDILVDAKGVEYDILSAAGAASTPTWGTTGGKVRPGREWVAPIVPQGGIVAPPNPPVPPVTPPPPPVVSRDAFAAGFQQINAFYAAPEGLQRPGGMVLHGAADVAAMIQWGYDLVTGTPVERILATIRTSDEWRQKHP